MNPRNKKIDTVKSHTHARTHSSFIVSEPKLIKDKKSISITSSSIFKQDEASNKEPDAQISHAIYEMEIMNSNQCRKK